jgi:hypothetical protein
MLSPSPSPSCLNVEAFELTSRFPLLVTGLLTTPGVCGKAVASSPLSLPLEICRSFVKRDRLSRRDPTLPTFSLAKYPSFPFGGLPGPGLAILLCPLALLLLFLLLPFLSLALCMLINVGGPPGLNILLHAPVGPAPPNGVSRLFIAWGVMSMGSSTSSGSIGSPSSEELDESSEPSMFIEPTELEAAVLSPLPLPLPLPFPLPHVECVLTFGLSRIMLFALCLLEGIIMPFCVIVGDESGDDWSASVEWWRFVQAREYSAPLDRRGNREAGEAYVFRESSCGLSGTRAAKCAGDGMGISRDGICNESPLDSNSGLRGVLGAVMLAWWSSLDLRAGSLNFGDGDRACGAESESERGFGGVLAVKLVGSSASSMAAALWLAKRLSIKASTAGTWVSGIIVPISVGGSI